MHCLSAHDRDAGTVQGVLKRLHNVLGTVAHGKYPIAPLRFQRNAQLLKVRHHILRSIAGECAVQELAVACHIGEECFPVALVGEIAPSLSGDAKLSSDLFVLF